MVSHWGVRKATVCSLVFVTPLGFLFKFYTGPGGWWFRDYGAGALYEIFWILVVFLFYPHKRTVLCAPAWVFIVTCALEVLQLWHPPILEAIRSTFMGRTLIGTTFAWGDFPHYALGCLLGWIWIGAILARHPSPEGKPGAHGGSLA